MHKWEMHDDYIVEGLYQQRLGVPDEMNEWYGMRIESWKIY